MDESTASPVGPVPSAAGQSRPRRASRRRLPRFGLRSLFAFSLLCCLFFAWIGRNVYEMRQDQAAIDALNKVQRTIALERDDPASSGGWLKPENALDLPGYSGLPRRLVGFPVRPRINGVFLECPRGREEATDAALAALERFPETTTVQLHGPAVTDAGCESLSRIAGLETLELAHARVGEKGLRRLAPLSSLRMLWITQDDPSSDVVSAIPALQELRDLTLQDQPLTRESLAGVASLPHLESLAIRSPSSGMYDVLSTASNLRKLSIEGSDLDDDDLAAVAELRKLEYVKMSFQGDSGLAALAALPNLRSLCVKGTFAKDDFLAISAARPTCIFALEPPEPAPRVFFLGGEEVPGATVMAEVWK